MDSITHLALGACVGEILLFKRLGKKVLILGAVAQNLPDLDVLASLWTSPAENLLVHRGITHSLFFGIAAAALLSFGIRKVWRSISISFVSLFLFLCLQFWLHDLLDAFTAYGTGLLEPFGHQRYSFHLLFVGDPLFSVSLIATCVALLFLRKENPHRRRWAFAGLVPALLYLGSAAHTKMLVQAQAKKELAAQGIPYKSMFTTPTPFNTRLWYVVAATESGYVTGYYTAADTQPLAFTYHLQNKHLLQSVDSKINVKALVDFAAGYYTISEAGDMFVFNILRFGQPHGWQYPQAPFSFRYFLDPTYDNTLVMQRGRVQGWNRQSIMAMYRRLKGN